MLVGMQVLGAHEAMMVMGMMFREIIRKVVSALAPVDDELALADAVLDPVEFHIDAFGAALLDGVVGDAGGDGIVGLDRGGGLGMAHFFEAGAEGTGLSTVVEEATQF